MFSVRFKGVFKHYLSYLTPNLCSNSGYIKINNEALPCFTFVAPTKKCSGLKKFSSKPELIATEDKHLALTSSNDYTWFSGFTDGGRVFLCYYYGSNL